MSQGRVNSNAKQEYRKRNVSKDGVPRKQGNEKAVYADDQADKAARRSSFGPERASDGSAQAGRQEALVFSFHVPSEKRMRRSQYLRIPAVRRRPDEVDSRGSVPTYLFLLAPFLKLVLRCRAKYSITAGSLPRRFFTGFLSRPETLCLT